MLFTYGERLGDGQIRLLEIVEGHGHDPLHVKLAPYRLDAAEFEALSYVWGDATKTRAILCNGRTFHITESLHAALLERRRRGITSLMWADAMCINQRDTDERTSQVRMMRQIYSKAQRVVVWLGQDVPHDAEGIRLADRIYNTCDGASFDIDDVSGGVRGDDIDFFTKGLPEPRTPPSTNLNPEWTSLFDMMDHPWFTRVWVIQELLVAKQSVVWRGKFQFDPRSILFAAVLAVTRRNLSFVYGRYTVERGSSISSHLMWPAYRMAKLYFQYRKKGAQPYWDTLRHCGSMQASDTRDKYFALVGISSGVERELVDYSKSLRQIKAQVGYICLRGLPELGMPSSGLDLLVQQGTVCYPPEDTVRSIDRMYPEFGEVSWAPRLLEAHPSRTTLAAAYPTAELCSTKNGYTAARADAEFRFLLEVEQVQAARTACPVPVGLAVKGSPLGHIRTVARPYPSLVDEFRTTSLRMETAPAPTKPDPWRVMTQQYAETIIWLLELRSMACQSSDEDFWRTLVHNRDGKLRPAPQSLGDSFACWYMQGALLIETWLTCGRLDHVLDQAWLLHVNAAARPFEEAWSNFRDQRVFFVAGDGRIGWVPYNAKPGDHLYVSKGMRVPVVLRPVGNSGSWQLVGACYIHGLMDGEAEDMAENQWQWQKIL